MYKMYLFPLLPRSPSHPPLNAPFASTRLLLPVGTHPPPQTMTLSPPFFAPPIHLLTPPPPLPFFGPFRLLLCLRLLLLLVLIIAMFLAKKSVFLKMWALQHPSFLASQFQVPPSPLPPPHTHTHTHTTTHHSLFRSLPVPLAPFTRRPRSGVAEKGGVGQGGWRGRE